MTMEGVDKLPLSPRALAKIANAATWENDRVSKSLESVRHWRFVAGAGAVIGLLGFAMTTFVLLRPPPEPATILVDRITGETQFVARASVPTLSAMDQHHAAVYVRAREGYFFSLLQNDYNQVARMSTPEVFTPYGAKFVGHEPMHKTVGTAQEHRITIVSARLTQAHDAGRPGEIIVTFDKEVRFAQGDPSVTTRYVATVKYEYRPASMKKDKDRFENPFGFVALAYRADAELVAPPKPGEAAAAVAATGAKS